MTKIAPLSGSFMAVSIAGFIISAYLIMPRNNTWGFTMLIFFATMFISAYISMTKGPIVN